MTDLEKKISLNSEEAIRTTAQLKDTCAALERQKEELSAKLEESVAQLATLHTQLQRQQESLESAKEDLLEAEDTVSKWQGKVRRVGCGSCNTSKRSNVFFSPF
jgi:chromosome segregation ATPase